MAPNLAAPCSSNTSDEIRAQYSFPFPEFYKIQNEEVKENSKDNTNSDEVINEIIFSYSIFL